jgi:hypothetical protein
MFLLLFTCGLEQCNDRAALPTKSCNDCKRRMKLSFYWDAFDIERMIEKKMVSSNFSWGSSRPTYSWVSLILLLILKILLFVLEIFLFLL